VGTDLFYSIDIFLVRAGRAYMKKRSQK